MELDDIVDKFNAGDLNVDAYFNDYKTFFNFLKKRNLFWKLDPIYGPDSSDWQNEYLIWLYENDFIEQFNHWMSKLLNDVVFDNGTPVLNITDFASELSILFCENHRNCISKKTIEAILSGEDIDFIDYYITNIKDEVIDKLNKRNIEELKKNILNLLKDKKLEPTTDLMEEIAEEQGHDGFWYINEENISELLNSDSINDLLNINDLIDLGSELRNIGSYALNHAYENELYNNVWGELSEYFDVENKKFTDVPHPIKKDTSVETFSVPIVNFYDFILNYLKDYKDYGNSGTLEYHGNLMSIMSEHIDCLCVYPPHYPDYSLYIENLNEYFQDYIG